MYMKSLTVLGAKMVAAVVFTNTLGAEDEVSVNPYGKFWEAS